MRGEWRGRSDRFEVLDRNNDGVISRSEMLPAGDDDESSTFMSADLNRDNRLSQREWQWSQRVFSDQDTNRDGFVSREEFWNPGAATGTSGYADNRTVNSPVVVQVSATERWVDTGLDTRVGDVLRITSTGTVRLSYERERPSRPRRERTGEPTRHRCRSIRPERSSPGSPTGRRSSSVTARMWIA